MAKYQTYVKEMYREHKKEFDSFKKVHDLFKNEPKKYIDEFNKVGAPIGKIMEETEKRLCFVLENGNNSAYSALLSEKFRAEVKKTYPMIEMIGMKIEFGN